MVNIYLLDRFLLDRVIVSGEEVFRVDELLQTGNILPQFHNVGTGHADVGLVLKQTQISRSGQCSKYLVPESVLAVIIRLVIRDLSIRSAVEKGHGG